MTVIKVAALVTIPTGESRSVESVWPDGSYRCPWCLYVVRGTEAGCQNPACFARVDPPMTVAEIERIREAAMTQVREEAVRLHNHELAMQRIEDEKQRDRETWAVARAEAERRGCCVTCLARSDWRSYRLLDRYPNLKKQVRFVKHRGPCPNGGS